MQKQEAPRKNYNVRPPAKDAILDMFEAPGKKSAIELNRVNTFLLLAPRPAVAEVVESLEAMQQAAGRQAFTRVQQEELLAFAAYSLAMYPVEAPQLQVHDLRESVEEAPAARSAAEAIYFEARATLEEAQEAYTEAKKAKFASKVEAQLALRKVHAAQEAFVAARAMATAAANIASVASEYPRRKRFFEAARSLCTEAQLSSTTSAMQLLAMASTLAKEASKMHRPASVAASKAKRAFEHDAAILGAEDFATKEKQAAWQRAEEEAAPLSNRYFDIEALLPVYAAAVDIAGGSIAATQDAFQVAYHYKQERFEAIAALHAEVAARVDGKVDAPQAASPVEASKVEAIEEEEAPVESPVEEASKPAMQVEEAPVESNIAPQGAEAKEEAMQKKSAPAYCRPLPQHIARVEAAVAVASKHLAVEAPVDGNIAPQAASKVEAPAMFDRKVDAIEASKPAPRRSVLLSTLRSILLALGSFFLAAASKVEAPAEALAPQGAATVEASRVEVAPARAAASPVEAAEAVEASAAPVEAIEAAEAPAEALAGNIAPQVESPVEEEAASKVDAIDGKVEEEAPVESNIAPQAASPVEAPVEEEARVDGIDGKQAAEAPAEALAPQGAATVDAVQVEAGAPGASASEARSANEAAAPVHVGACNDVKFEELGDGFSTRITVAPRTIRESLIKLAAYDITAENAYYAAQKKADNFESANDIDPGCFDRAVATSKARRALGHAIEEAKEDGVELDAAAVAAFVDRVILRTTSNGAKWIKLYEVYAAHRAAGRNTEADAMIEDMEPLKKTAEPMDHLELIPPVHAPTKFVIDGVATTFLPVAAAKSVAPKTEAEGARKGCIEIDAKALRVAANMTALEEAAELKAAASPVEAPAKKAAPVAAPKAAKAPASKPAQAKKAAPVTASKVEASKPAPVAAPKAASPVEAPAVQAAAIIDREASSEAEKVEALIATTKERLQYWQGATGSAKQAEKIDFFEGKLAKLQKRLQRVAGAPASKPAPVAAPKAASPVEAPAKKAAPVAAPKAAKAPASKPAQAKKAAPAPAPMGARNDGIKEELGDGFIEKITAAPASARFQLQIIGSDKIREAVIAIPEGAVATSAKGWSISKEAAEELTAAAKKAMRFAKAYDYDIYRDLLWTVNSNFGNDGKSLEEKRYHSIYNLNGGGMAKSCRYDVTFLDANGDPVKGKELKAAADAQKEAEDNAKVEAEAKLSPADRAWRDAAKAANGAGMLAEFIKEADATGDILKRNQYEAAAAENEDSYRKAIELFYRHTVKEADAAGSTAAERIAAGRPATGCKLLEFDNAGHWEQVDIAKAAATPVELLEHIAEEWMRSDSDFLKALAINPATPASLLDEVAAAAEETHNSGWAMRKLIAEHPAASEELVAKLFPKVAPVAPRNDEKFEKLGDEKVGEITTAEAEASWNMAREAHTQASRERSQKQSAIKSLSDEAHKGRAFKDALAYADDNGMAQLKEELRELRKVEKAADAYTRTTYNAYDALRRVDIKAANAAAQAKAPATEERFALDLLNI